MQDHEMLNLINEAITILEKLRDGIRGVAPQPPQPPVKPQPFEKKD